MQEGTIADIRFVSAPPAQRHSGLLGWASFVAGSLRIDGVALRRTLDGHYALSFPARRDRSGRQHPFVRPLDECARRQIERQVFDTLGIDQEDSQRWAR